MSDQDDSTIEPDDVVTDPDDDGQGDGDTDQLGDAGKKALDSMKGRWREERDRRKALEARIAELEQGSGKKDDGDLVQAIAKAKAEAKAETLRERVLDRIEAKAARLFADPEDAVALLGRRADEFIDGDKIDSEEIAEALEGLLKKKPHLAATAQKRFAGSADGGARKGSKPDQLTRDDLKKMTPAQIVKAQDEGRLNDLMGVD
jgi:hypothetical protein